MGDNPTPNNLPKWRNWQTHQIQGLAPSRVSGFKSRLRHQPTFPLCSRHLRQFPNFAIIPSLSPDSPLQAPSLQ